MPFFRKRPVVIEARQWDGKIETLGNLQEWAGKDNLKVEYIRVARGGVLQVMTLEGSWVNVHYGAWIIKGVKGEFYPCNPGVFEQTYEAMDV